jgi:hypothetical protein
VRSLLLGYDIGMRSRAPIFALLLIVGSFAFSPIAHAGIQFFGPIIPVAYNVCPASWGMLIDVINNIIQLAIIIVIVFIAPIMIAYAGFLYVVNPVNPSGIKKAKDLLINTVVGIVIALAGWMIVDAIMLALYNPETRLEGGKLGAWADLIGSRGMPPCIELKGSTKQTTSGVPITGISATGKLNLPPTDGSGAACNPAAVQAAAAAGGYNITPVQANTLACIARPESSCGSKILNYNWGKGSSAAGAFQVLLSTHSQCYENSACYTAVGLQSGAKLDCSSGFSGGNPKLDNEGKPLKVVQTCVSAAANLNCSTSAAACLLKQNGGNFSPWQKDVNSAKQTGCINSGG